MKIFSLLYNSFIWGLLTAIIAFQNEWLEMRISVGLIVPIVMILVASVVLISKKPVNLSGKFTSANLLASLLLAFLVLGSKRLLVVPAAMIREVLKMTDISIPAINTVLGICLILGLIVIWVWKPKGE